MLRTNSLSNDELRNIDALESDLKIYKDLKEKRQRNQTV